MSRQRAGQAAAEAARERPGEWVDLEDGLTRKQAHSKVTMVGWQPNAAFQPRGSFKARQERRDDGTYLVQVCYIGEQ